MNNDANSPISSSRQAMDVMNNLRDMESQRQAVELRKRERDDKKVHAAELAASNIASNFYNQLVTRISEFDRMLDNDFEVGAKLVTFGQAVTFSINELGYMNPSLIIFGGTAESGEPVELIQHISQISILLTKIKRANPDEPKKPIGFAHEHES